MTDAISFQEYMRRTQGDLNTPREQLSEAEWAERWKRMTPYQRRCHRMRYDPTVAPHGVPSTYLNWGCRCDPCTKAYSEKGRAKRVEEDFKEQPGPPVDRDPLAQALYAREQGWDLTPMAQRLISEYEHDVI